MKQKKQLSLYAISVISAVSAAMITATAFILINPSHNIKTEYTDMIDKLSDISQQLDEEKSRNDELSALLKASEHEINQLKTELKAAISPAPEPPEPPEPAPPDGEIDTDILMNLLKYPPIRHASVALYYEDAETGNSIVYNADKPFYCASLVKLPFAVELLFSLEAIGGNDGLDDMFIYTEDNWQCGSGTIVNEPYGTAYTYYELLILMLKDSDNVAFAELVNKYGEQLISDFTAREKLTELSYDDWTLTAEDCIKILRQTHKYTDGKYRYSTAIKQALLGSSHRVLLCTVGKPVAHKYGWDELAYHDIGIIYSEHPYYLAILTDMDSGDNDVNKYIQSLVKEVDRIHCSNYADERN